MYKRQVLKGIGIINQKLISKTDFFYKLGRRFSACYFLTAIDIFSILRYTKSVLIPIVQLVCYLLTFLTEIYYEKEKNN